MRRLATALALVALIAGCGEDDASEETSAGRFDSERAFEDLRSLVEIGPRAPGTPGARRAREFILGRLADAGIERVATQRPHANVIGYIPGTEEGVIVLGAHYDTKTGIPGFVGANDNASGVAVLLELARTLPRPLPGPSVELVFFDAEESRGNRPFEVDGMRGSRQFVEIAAGGGGQGAPPISDIRAMVLFDLVGDCELEIPREEASDPRLYEAFADAARERTGDTAPFEGETGPILDDHIPFVQEDVPAVDLIDFDFGPGPSPGAWWHTAEDTIDKVCAQSLDAVGEAALIVVGRTR